MAQSPPINGDCSMALVLCPDSIYSTDVDSFYLDCVGGGVGDCLSSGTWGQCYDVKSSLWFSFLTNNFGGDAEITFENISFADSSGGFIDISVLSMDTLCQVNTYNSVFCDTSFSSDFSINMTNLLADNQYFIHINVRTINDSSQYANFDISIEGTAIEREVYFTIDEVICNQSFGMITADSTNFLNPPYTFALNGSAFQVSNVFSDISYGNQVFHINDNDGCITNHDIFVDGDFSNMFVNTGEDEIILPNNTVEISADHNGVSFYWLPSTTLENPNLETTNATPLNTTTYIAHAVSPESCILTAEQKIEVLPRLAFANTITPNNDGINDTWIVLGIEKYPNAIVTIYSQWGEKLFELEGYNSTNAWNGEFNGRPSPVGTYYFIIDLNVDLGSKEERIYKGFINLMR